MEKKDQHMEYLNLSVISPHFQPSNKEDIEERRIPWGINNRCLSCLVGVASIADEQSLVIIFDYRLCPHSASPKIRNYGDKRARNSNSP